MVIDGGKTCVNFVINIGHDKIDGNEGWFSAPSIHTRTVLYAYGLAGWRHSFVNFSQLYNKIRTTDECFRRGNAAKITILLCILFVFVSKPL